MLIYCPKCFTGYEISEDLIKDRSRKVRCSHCNEIFEAGSLIEKSVDNIGEMEDISEENAFEALAAMMRDANMLEENVFEAQEENNIEIALEDETSDTGSVKDDTVVNENIVEQNVDISNGEVESEEEDDLDVEDNEKDIKENELINIESIYERLSEHTSHLIEREKTLPIYEKIWFKIKEVLGFHFKIKWSYIIIGVLVFISLSLFNNRYDVVRKFPFMNGVYKAFGIKAKIAGEGLEFQNIIWDYVVDNGVKRVEVKGFINNMTTSTIEVPIVHVEILDKKTSLLQSFNREIKEKEISSAGRVPLQIIIENPAPTTKYIYLTFIDKE